VQFRMPSSQSVARTLEQLRLPNSRLTLGVAAAAAASVAAVAGASASGAPAVGATHPAGSASHVTAFQTHAPPAQHHAEPTVRIGSGMQLTAAQAPSPATTTGQSTAPQPATTTAAQAQPAAAPSAATSSPSSAAAPTVRIGAGMQLIAVPHASEETTASQDPATAAAPAQPAATPSQPAAPAAAPAAAAAPAPAPQPYTLYDSVTPSSLPASSQAVAVYANGSYAAQPSQVGKRGLTLWIDTNGSDPNADVLDVEPGDATPAQAAAWVQQKLDASPNSTAIVYTMRSDWGAVQAAIGQLAWWMPSHTKYWIADPTGVPHLVPGSQATQWYWGQNYDASLALPSFN